jgi:hypothetical protein
MICGAGLPAGGRFGSCALASVAHSGRIARVTAIGSIFGNQSENEVANMDFFIIELSSGTLSGVYQSSGNGNSTGANQFQIHNARNPAPQS